MKFSILVPVYNVEKYLEQCVESLLNQTYTDDYEIILVDDGSTDSSGKICDKYAETQPDKIKVIHKKNEGLVSARQAGINCAKGEYCLFVDSDDFVELNLLETVNGCLERNNSTDIVIYSFNYCSEGKKTSRKVGLSDKETVFRNEGKRIIYEALISSSLVTALWIKAVKTELLINDPTDYTLYYKNNMAEDWFRSIPLLTAAQKIVCINALLYNYRTNLESISRSYRAETIPKKNTLYVYERLREYLPIWGLDDEEHRQKLSARFFNEAMYTFSKYYENVKPEERKAVLNFDWDTMIPEAAKSDTDNPYENKTYKKLYLRIIKKDFGYVRLFLIKKEAEKFLRKLLK